MCLSFVYIFSSFTYLFQQYFTHYKAFFFIPDESAIFPEFSLSYNQSAENGTLTPPSTDLLLCQVQLLHLVLKGLHLKLHQCLLYTFQVPPTIVPVIVKVKVWVRIDGL